MTVRQLIRTDPRLVREVLAQAEREGMWVTATRRGLQHSTVFRWRERRRADPAWPDDDYVARWDADAARRDRRRAWNRAYKHDRYLGRKRKIDATGSTRRLQALYALGWTSRQIGPRLGVSHARVGHLVNGMYPLILRSTADRIREVYDELSMTVPQDPDPIDRGKCRIHARQRRQALARGFLPPLAWDDDRIDDPTAVPYVEKTQGAADEAVVERILAGDWRLACTPADKTEVARRWHAAGRSMRSLHLLTRWRTERYFKPTQAAA